MKKYSLQEFVELCNKCEMYIDDSPLDDSKKMAKDFITMIKCEKFNEDIFDNSNIDNLYKNLYDARNNSSFYRCLKQRGVEKEYALLWNSRVTARINVWEPMYRKNKLNQKWHILISVLAFLDTAANDPNFILYGGDKKYCNVKELNEITFCPDKRRYLLFDEINMGYCSIPMKYWIYGALK